MSLHKGVVKHVDNTVPLIGGSVIVDTAPSCPFIRVWLNTWIILALPVKL